MKTKVCFQGEHLFVNMSLLVDRLFYSYFLHYNSTANENLSHNAILYTT